ncbi:MAG: response regulator [Archaeoglobaceae archaeon]|nr:response regulator [Archaeoglobaceae archaeon]MDW8127924.1 response regulator [Archaeoglobaceae archaeon]
MNKKVKKTVLVVEDDLALLEALELMLKDHYNVIKATNGKEAIKLYYTVKPDLVLTDIVMPEMDGIKATEEILRNDPNAKIVGITAYYLSKEKDLINAGAKEVLEKPFTRRKLLETLDKYLQS